MSSDHLAIAKIFSEWKNSQNTDESMNDYRNTSLSNASLILMLSEYNLTFFFK